MSKIKGLNNFDKEPINLDTRRIDEIMNSPMDKDLENICKLLSKD